MTVNCTTGQGLNYTRRPLVGLRLFARWLLHGSGILASNLIEGVAWVRSHDDPDMATKTNDLTSASLEPDMELFSVPAYYTNMVCPEP